MERFELGTKYPHIVHAVRSMLLRAPFRRHLSRTRLLVDGTGVGRSVVEQFYEGGIYPIPVTITGGSTVTQELDEDSPFDRYRVPKRDLAGVVQVLLQNGRLKIAKGLALTPTLKKELLNFRVKIDPKTAHDSYEAWREGDHDDLVLATALACWYAERSRKETQEEWWFWGNKPPSKPSEFDRRRP
jgi:hypothetical protein